MRRLVAGLAPVAVPVLLAVALTGALLTGCQSATVATPLAPSDPAPSNALSNPALANPAPAAVSSPGPGAPATSDQPVVVLDPGHNGGNAAHPEQINRQVPDGRGGHKACNTTGTATDAGYAEHAFTWDVAQRVQTALTARGVRVVLTRADDSGVGPCVDERGAAGERAGAAAVVSIHADGSGPAAYGFHVAYSDPPLNDAQRAPTLQLATAMRDAFTTAGFPRSTYLGREGLAPRPDLAGLNLATRPTVLVECANMRNPAEAAAASSPEGRARYAAAIAEGVLAFLGPR